MIRNLLATTAIATLVATGAFAQTTPTAPTAPPAGGAMVAPEAPMVIRAEGNLASNIIGKRVYNGITDDAENIGRVNDLVINPDGTVQAVVIGVGGFLGIGQKDVAIEFDLVRWEQRDNDRYLVVETTREVLEAQEEFDQAAFRPMPADADVREPRPATAQDLAAAPAQDAADGELTEDMAAAPADGDAVVTEQDTAAAPADGDAAATDETVAQAPAEGEAVVTTEQETAAAPADQVETDTVETGAIDRSTLQGRPLDQIRAEDFIGTTVYGANDERIGEIGDVVLSQDGQVDAVLVDVGGWLGIGEKEVALGMDNLQFMADEDGDLYLYTNLTKEQVEAQPEYDETGYAENRDNMRLNVPAMQ